MNNPDKPITNPTEDILGRSEFAKNLAEAILSIKNTDNLTIGLFGEWGSGKTSIINMMIAELHEKSKSRQKMEQPLVIKFEPWNFTDDTNLFIQFFKQMQKQMAYNDGSLFVKELGNALENYSDAIAIAELVPYLGKYAKLINKSILYAGVGLRRIGDSKQTIISAKENLTKKLKEQKRKIVVIIDDIDRLSNYQIQLIFQLVNSVAGLSNMVYVLSMDKEVVSRALESVQNCNGEKYLEKIVQVPIEVPVIDGNRVIKLFVDKLNEVIQNGSDANFDHSHWSKILSNCINPNVKSIRDANRIANVFTFNYGFIKDEINFIDLIAITVVQVMIPKLYTWVIGNKRNLCGSTNMTEVLSTEKIELNREVYKAIFKDMGFESSNAFLILEALFPKFEREVKYFYEVTRNDELRKSCRIAHEDKFDLYFSLSLDKTLYSKTEIIGILTSKSNTEIEDLINSKNKSEELKYLVEEVLANIVLIPEERIGMVAQNFLRNFLLFSNETKQVNLQMSLADRFSTLILALFNKIVDPEQRNNMIQLILSHADSKILDGISPIIYQLYFQYHKNNESDSDDSSDKLEMKHMEAIEEKYVYILGIIMNGNFSIFDFVNVKYVLFLWKNIDIVGCKEYLNSLFKDNLSVFRFVTIFASEHNGGSGKRWSYDMNFLHQLIDDEFIMECYQKTPFDELNGVLSDDEIQKFVIYLVSRTLSADKYVSLKDVSDYLDKFMS
jgi:predicted KAP-like P-loop ATPase